MSIHHCCVAVLLVLVCVRDAPARTWTDGQGKSIEADFVRVVEGKVVLKRSGRLITVPLSELSDADQEFIRMTLPTRFTIQTTRVRQEFQGLGCGVQWYEAHITSLAERHNDDRQRELYDDMFAKVPTRYLHLGIRPDYEPENDNTDPYAAEFDQAKLDEAWPLVEIAQAAKARRPDIELLVTLGTPPAWMKTNNDISGGRSDTVTLKPGLELEFAEYIWTFLAHMAKNEVPVKYVAISNECDWPHEQPGCFFTPEAHAALFKVVGEYFETMAAKNGDVPRPILVGPNTLGAPGAAEVYLPAMVRAGAEKYLGAIAAHDYDPRGDRWGNLQKISGERPVWMTEWCWRSEDESPGQINAGTEYARSMHDVFTGGANVYMAYDWVYPPRLGGEALIHVDWGQDYTLKKPYWVFRQWATPLSPGMHLVQVDAAGPNVADVKATAFLSQDRQSLVVHVVNCRDVDVPIELNVSTACRDKRAARHRTSATEDMAALPPLEAAAGEYADTLPARSVTTYQLELR